MLVGKIVKSERLNSFSPFVRAHGSDLKTARQSSQTLFPVYRFLVVSTYSVLTFLGTFILHLHDRHNRCLALFPSLFSFLGLDLGATRQKEDRAREPVRL